MVTDLPDTPNMKKVNQPNGPTVNLNTVLTYGASALLVAVITVLHNVTTEQVRQGQQIEDHESVATELKRRSERRFEKLETWTRAWPQTGELKVDVRQNDKLKELEKWMAEIQATLKELK